MITENSNNHDNNAYTTLNIPDIPNTSRGSQTVIIVNPQSSSSTSLRTGEFGILFGILGMFVLAIIFVPLGIIFGITAMKRQQVMFGLIGVVLSLIAVLISPTFWAIFMAMTGSVR